jgi:hypothetical protein
VSNDKSVEKWKQKASNPTPRVKPHSVFFNPESTDEQDHGGDTSKTDHVNKPPTATELPADQKTEETMTQVQTETLHVSDKSIVQNEITNLLETGVKQIKTTKENEMNNEHMNSTHLTDTNDVHIKGKQMEITEQISPIQAFFEITKQRETVEDTHTRKTFIIKNELLKRFEKLQKKHGRGFQTWFINEAIQRLLIEIEGNKK